MSFAQKDRLDRIQHTLLPTTEKKFHRKRMKNDEIRAFLCEKCRSLSKIRAENQVTLINWSITFY